MSQAAVSTILAQMLRDRGFAAQLRATPDEVMDGFDLTPEERATLLAWLVCGAKDN